MIKSTGLGWLTRGRVLRRCLKPFVRTTLLLCAALLVLAQPALAQFTQQGSKLVGSGAVNPAWQGWSVALSEDGNTAIVGGYTDNGNTGAAWVYTRSGGVWSEEAKLVGAGATGSAYQGYSVSLSADGNTAIVGGINDNSGAGAAWVFTRSGTTWSEEAKLVGTGGTADANQGTSVALSDDGNTAIVGADYDSTGMGAAWVFTRSGTTWSQQDKLVGTGTTGNARQGHSVALSDDGNTAIVGGFSDDANAGAAWVFTRSGATWTQQGDKLFGTGAAGSGKAQQGTSVAISGDGDIAIVGGPADDVGGAGAVWVFTRSGGVWSQQGSKLVGSGAAGNAQQGYSVSISGEGNLAVVGGRYDNSDAGAAWTFVRVGGVWSQQGSKLVGTGAVGTANQGHSVALSADGNTAIVGGIFDNTNAGAAWIFSQPPVGVTDVSPSSGTTAGGAEVTITGRGFTNTTGVTFDGAAATGVTVVDGHTITATTPAHTAGLVDVVVTTSDLGSGTGSNAFRYLNPTTTSVGSSANPSVSGQSVTFTAAVTCDASPTGTVTFKDGGSTLDSSSLSSGTATYSTAVFSVGNHSITAEYAGDSNCAASASSTLTQTVNKGATSTGLGASPSSSSAGQSITFTATVAATAPASGSPTGTVTFREGSTTLGNSALASGQATFSTSALKIGSHTITASYGGSSDFNTSSGSTTVTVSATQGSESRVNSTTADAQQLPAVARLKSNGYVIVWASNGQDGSGYGIYGQRYTFTGAKAGSQFKVNTTTTGAQTQPAVAGLANGTFVVVWQSPGDGSGTAISGQRFTAAGAKAGGEFRVNTTAAGNQSQVAIAALDGGFVVAWTSSGQDGSGLGIYAQRYNANGAKAGAEFTVNKTTAGSQSAPAVAALANGGFVIAWQGPDASGNGIFMRRYNANGVTTGNDFKVNTVVVNDQSLPAIAALDSGGFVIAWQSNLQDGSGFGVYKQRFNAAGVRAGGAALVNTVTVNHQSTPVAAGFTDEGFVIVWASIAQDGSGWGLYAQVFDDAGAKVNAEFRVNTTTAGHQYQPAVAAFASGKLVAVWTSANQDGSSTGIYAQRFQVPMP